MKPTIRIDSREWQRAANELFQTSSRSCVDFTNGQALRVASWAIPETEKANRVKIEHIMGILSSTERRRGGRAGAKGWVRITKRVMKENSFAERIVAKRFQETGSWFGLKGKTLAEKAKSLVAAKVRSVGFIKSGWIQAVRTLSGIVYKKPRGLTGRIADAKQYGQVKGYAIAATFGIKSKIQATIVNTALTTQGKFSTWHGGSGDPLPVAERGLQKSINRATADMIQTLEKRLQPDFKKFNGK